MLKIFVQNKTVLKHSRKLCTILHATKIIQKIAPITPMNLLTAETFRKAWGKLLRFKKIEEEMIERNNDREGMSDIHQITRCISSYADYKTENTAEWIGIGRNKVVKF